MDVSQAVHLSSGDIEFAADSGSHSQPMDLISHLAINEVALNATTTGKRATKALERIQQLETENRELRIRIGVLIRLLIERGIFSAEDFDGAVKQAQAQLSPRLSANQAPNRTSRPKKG